MSKTSFEDLMRQLPSRIARVHSAPLTLHEPFVDVARRFAHLPGTVALMSGGSLDSARYHILGIEPWLTLTENAAGLDLRWNGGAASGTIDPFAALQALVRRYALPASGHALPLSAGLLGYLAYDLKDCLEVLPRTSVDDLGLPRLCMFAPSVLTVQDLQDGSTTVHLPVLEGDQEGVESRLARFEVALSRPATAGNALDVRTGHPTSGFSRSAYIAAVEAVRDYIVRGHVYQVNLSQRFELDFSGDPFALYSGMYAVNPAPFFAFVHAGDHQIISTSPERFISLRGREVETRPIKGTRPRGKTPDEDERMRRDLEGSLKDQAELSMIVDLLRNDIGKVCSGGSVRVTEHKRVEAYENVYHLVSIVRGVLDEEYDAVDLIRATFPGGSITGCPKIRSTEIIDELEPVRRHVYTGSIGYIGFEGDMDLSIAIRTAVAKEGKLYFSVGGGIVYDSKAHDEYDETLHKGQTLLRAVSRHLSDVGDHGHYCWHNGSLKLLREVQVSVGDEGFAYGYGIFETVRVQNGRALMLDAHLDRFARGWEACFSGHPPDITWSDVIQQIIDKNGLQTKTAAVKLLAAAGNPGRAGSHGTLLVTAREYAHRLAGTGRNGLRLGVYPHGRHTPLAAHKTMNYMLYRMAGKWASENQADEALILNADDTVSETNTANVFCVIGGTVCRPVSGYALPGTMESAVCRLLSQWGRSVEARRLSVDDLKKADQVFVTNSLMGAVPVLRIDDSAIAEGDGLCQRLNDVLLGV